MTVEEAIYDLEQYAKQWLGGEAIEMAIRSLKAWREVREEVLKTQTYKMFEGDTDLYVERKDVLKIIEKHLKEVENADSD